MTGEDLKKRLQKEGFILADVAKKLTMSPQHLNQALSAADVKSGLLERISKGLSISISSLYGETFSVSPAGELRPRIPLTAIAGRLPDITSSVTLADCEMLPAVRLLPPYKCTIIIQGDSMEPKFEGGDEIAIREVVDYIEWGKTYVLDTEDGPVLKRLYDDGDSFRCVSYNPDYPPFTIEKQKVYRVFKVVGLIRRCN